MSMGAIAGGTVYPARFVKEDGVNDGVFLQCGSGDQPRGVSFRDTRRSPYVDSSGELALINEPFSLYTPGERCWLLVSATVVPGNKLKPDTNGEGVPVTTDGDYYGAIADANGVAGQLIPVFLVVAQQAS
jgi:hypothetical protein